jgi:hypothetical protein
VQAQTVQDFEVIRHKPGDTSLNYGVWRRFRKEAA